MVAVSPVSRYPGEQEKVQWDPAALRELVQEMLPCAGADRDGEQRATTKNIMYLINWSNGIMYFIYFYRHKSISSVIVFTTLVNSSVKTFLIINKFWVIVVFLIPHLIRCSIIIKLLSKQDHFKLGQNLICCTEFDLQLKVYRRVWNVHQQWPLKLTPFDGCNFHAFPQIHGLKVSNPFCRPPQIRQTLYETYT